MPVNVAPETKVQYRSGQRRATIGLMEIPESKTHGQRCHCGAVAQILFDHCLTCQLTLCPVCFDLGCCGVRPAASGTHAKLGEYSLDVEFG
jgi:hypothetical protein